MTSFDLINKYIDSQIQYEKSDNIVQDIKGIIESTQRYAYSSINRALVLRNWLIGKRIAEEELKGEARAEYGAEILKTIAKEMKKTNEKGMNQRNLYYCVRFYECFPQILHAVSSKSHILSWTHYRCLLQVQDKAAREWYEKEAIAETWSSRTLQRNISTQYYYRLLKSQDQRPVKEEMMALTSKYQQDKLEFIKNPVIAEFLGISEDTSYRESDLEQFITNNLQKFIMELGKGYAFIGRQQHIRTEKDDYFIDLVFYNYILKCFVLFDLKTGTITHQDVGQMDMYVRMYDELKRNEEDNPTLGIVLCYDTDEDIARYSVMHGNEQLFAVKYKLYLPSEEELRAEIEMQKTMFYLQQQEKEHDNLDDC